MKIVLRIILTILSIVIFLFGLHLLSLAWFYSFDTTSEDRTNLLFWVGIGLMLLAFAAPSIMLFRLLKVRR
jgi:hypothetical protein